MTIDVEKTKAEAFRLEGLGEFRAALAKYQQIVDADKENVEALFRQGEMHHQLGELPEALSAYIRVTDLDEEHKKANVKVQMILSILNYYNKDMINP
ncbi:tetratricopeptide repeat protein [Labilibaculum sp.]|uniref:tetratricopeptide repeat protein n=1 Tax=Labilibaculum sp. TaxID=2060723 RepID=UPI00356209AF